MRRRLLTIWSAGGVAGAALVSAAGGQEPGPPPAVAPPPIVAPLPVPPTGPSPRANQPTRGPIRRSLRHTWSFLQDNFVGYPQEFAEPPPGYYNAEIFSVMKSKANPHRFTLYRSDFLPGTDRLSPSGASRFNQMTTRLNGWPGPVLVEWSPDEPGLAEARRTAVLAMLQGTGRPVIPERVVIGPSPYPGLLGTNAANNYVIMITRDVAAPAQYSLTPSSGGGFGAGSGGGAP
jgi:hypothetical protein